MGKVWDFLGLVEEEDAWAPSPGTPLSGTRSTSSGNVRLIPDQPSDSHSSSSRSSSLMRAEVSRFSRERSTPSSQDAETEVLQVDSLRDCLHLTSWYKASVLVMLDLRFLSPEVAQGVVYYATGLVSYNQGEVSQVGDGLVLVSPPGVTVSSSEQSRLSKIGMWPSDPST